MYLLQSILLLRQADTLSYPTRRSSDLEFGHVVEVHPVDPGNNGGGEENSRPGRDLLRLLTLLESGLTHSGHLLVLALAYERDVHLHRGGEQVPKGVDPSQIGRASCREGV